jgi:hypothetical protein
VGILKNKTVFSLRGLFIFIAVLSIALGWFSWRLRRSNHQRSAVVALKGLGLQAYHSYTYDSTSQRVPDEPLGVPNWLLEILGDDFFYAVYVVVHRGDGPSLDDNDLPVLIEHLSSIPDLKFAHISWNCGLSRNGFARLRTALPNCRVVRSGDSVPAAMAELVEEYDRRYPGVREQLMRQVDEGSSKEAILKQFEQELNKIREEWGQ